MTHQDRSSRSFRTEALILKRRDFGESDRLLTLLTPQHGRRDAIAKGARKAISPRTGHVELFTRADLLLSRGRELDIVAQAQMLDPFLPLREDLQRGAYAAYVAELLLRLLAEGDDEGDTRFFEAVAAAFTHLSEPECDPRLAVRYFELHLLDLAGFRPELNQCVVTQEAIEPQDQYFSYAEGGVVSPRGVTHLSGSTHLPVRTLKLLRHMQRSPYSHVRSLTLAEPLHLDLERVMLGYITYLLERRLQSVDFIRRLRRA